MKTVLKRDVKHLPTGRIQVTEYGNSGSCQTVTQPQTKSVGINQKVYEIHDVLLEALKVSASIRADLFGEGESATDGMKPVTGHAQGALHDVLTLACNLRGELERIMTGVNANMSAVPKSKVGAHA